MPQAGKAKTKSTTTLLQEQKKLPESAWWGPAATIATAAATSFAGMTLATQVVFANPIVEDVQQQYTGKQEDHREKAHGKVFHVHCRCSECNMQV